ncbi:histone-lysine N-methyltransferase setd8-a [Plakobranchus ocellatus]|uniref:Histone-lysine N-methyltransferase setd8-a n=1 Tax=Plakobranchus ocellatus TaxID=259542 RepID=A0AAV4AM14_9GAST|nr:histone-lysine N-methyltransferase setd8-a [Plakobranchus ocellatus]
MWDKHNFVKVRNLVLSRLIMLDARRGGDPARLTVNVWREAITETWIDPNLIECFNNPMHGKYLIDNFKPAYQSGKRSRKLLPVIFPKDTLEPISKLSEERTNCNVAEVNIFLFSHTELTIDHPSGCHCPQTSVFVPHPSAAIPTDCTLDIGCQLDLAAENREMFYRHIGHSEATKKKKMFTSALWP